jgi:hypothetical protein
MTYTVECEFTGVKRRNRREKRTPNAFMDVPPQDYGATGFESGTRLSFVADKYVWISQKEL